MMKRMVRIACILLFDGVLTLGLFRLLSPTHAETNSPSVLRYVAVNSQCGVNQPCYASIQAAVDAANNGDEIRVAAGVYTGVSTHSGEIQIVYVDKSVHIQGGYDPNKWIPDPTINLTILDAQGQGRVITIIGAITPTVEGLWLTNGSSQNGGGVYIDQAAVTLRQNHIYSNTAQSWGGGIYASNSPAIIADNQIYSNTTGDNGRGGGLALSDSPAEVLTNTIRANRAHVGGGVELGNSLAGSSAYLFGNVIKNNTAFDYQYSGYTLDGAGGGVNIEQTTFTDTLRSNVIQGNTGKWGGGIHSFSASPLIEENTFQENNAPTHGGGLYVQGGLPSIQNNQILSNTTGNWGGGIAILASKAVVANNRFQGNLAGWRGGGLYGNADVDGNVFLNNQAVEGGGIFVPQGSSSVLFRNNAIVGNHATNGGGLYIWGAMVQFVHTTISSNTSNDGRGVAIDKYPGLVDPSSPTIAAAIVAFTNTILVSHTVGIFATSGNTVTVDGILWFNTPTHLDAAGAYLTIQHEFTGYPWFQDDGYHLQPQFSAAENRGVAVALDHDVDGELRPLGGYDLGADEIPIFVQVTPQVGAILTHTHQLGIHLVTTTVQVPADAITQPIQLAYSPFPPPPPWMTTSVFSRHIPLGFPFRLTPFSGGHPHAPVQFRSPVTVSVTYSGTVVSALRPGTGLYEAYLRRSQSSFASRWKFIRVDCPSTKLASTGNQPAATRANLKITVYLCNTGSTPTHSPPRRSNIMGSQGISTGANPEDEFIYFIILGEPVETKVYLPFLAR